MNSPLRALCLAALPLALAACQGETAQQSTAEGEILKGSTSDAMLPYDSVRSQPPLAPMPNASGRTDRKASDGGPEGTSTEGAEEAGPSATASAPTPTITLPAVP
jgi:hypothetical protein